MTASPGTVPSSPGPPGSTSRRARMACTKVATNSPMANWLGLSRGSRRISMEIAQLMQVAKADSDWVQVPDQEASFASIRFAPAQIDTIRRDPGQYHVLTSGVYLLKRYEIPAWSWARYPGHFTPKALLKKIVLK